MDSNRLTVSFRNYSSYKRRIGQEVFLTNELEFKKFISQLAVVSNILCTFVHLPTSCVFHVVFPTMMIGLSCDNIVNIIQVSLSSRNIKFFFHFQV